MIGIGNENEQARLLQDGTHFLSVDLQKRNFLSNRFQDVSVVIFLVMRKTMIQQKHQQ